MDGKALEESANYLPWWDKYRMKFASSSSSGRVRCLISGVPTEPLATVPKVSGLRVVGGHSSGDAFLCFDKKAFQSYGLEQSANAAVSEEAMTAVNAALEKLIAEAPIFGGAKIVHWYSSDIPKELDPAWSIFGFSGAASDEAKEEEASLADAEASAENAVRELISSVEKGHRTSELPARYYILPLSGAGGRMMVRGWYEGRFETLRRNIELWFSDLRIVDPYGKALTRPPKLKGLCTRLLKPGGDPKKLWDRVDDELANLSGRLLDSIISGTPLPDEVANRALRYIRSAMLASSEDGRSSPIENEHMAFELLKAWLIRRQRQKGDTNTMGEALDPSAKDIAYNCGRLMAVYGSIQKAAMPSVNVSVIERYYTSASTSPAFILGRLAQMSVHHLAMLDGEKPGLANFFRRQLETIASQMDQSAIPKTMNFEEQTRFALGYYQQRASKPDSTKTNIQEDA